MNQTLSDLAVRCKTCLARPPAPRDAQRSPRCCLTYWPTRRRSMRWCPSTGERDLLYQDPDLGFCILAHVYGDAKTSSPHDHGPSWAIYAQARGQTEMTDFELVSAASPDTPGTVRATQSYQLRPGDAHVYNEGDLHAPRRDGPTALLRIEGTDMSKVKRLRYEARDRRRMAAPRSSPS